MLWAFKHKILLEVAGHDHISDIRTHSASKLYSHLPDENCLNDFSHLGDAYFTSKLINPSITPTSDTQPGFASFDYIESTNTLSNLKMTFL